MGTNYYLVKNGPTCADPVHIGKSSYGWLFCFQETHACNAYEVSWHTWTQVKAELKRLTVDCTDYVIIDEYDRVISYDDFVALVESIQNDPESQNPRNFRDGCKNIDGYRFYGDDFW